MKYPTFIKVLAENGDVEGRLKEVMLNFLMDEVTNMYSSSDADEYGLVAELEDIAAEYFKNEARASEAEYQAEYQKGFVSGLKVYTGNWATPDQIKEASEKHMEDTFQYIWIFLPKKAALKAAFMEGRYWGKSTGYAYNQSRREEK